MLALALTALASLRRCPTSTRRRRSASRSCVRTAGCCSSSDRRWTTSAAGRSSSMRVASGVRCATWQVIGRRRRALRVRLSYVQSETHRHWHFPGFERYELRRLDGGLVGRDRKTGFCLRDAYETRALNRQPVWTSECARGRPERGGPAGNLSGLRRRLRPAEGGPIDRRHRPRRPVRARAPRQSRPRAARAFVCEQRGFRAPRAAGARARILRRCPSGAACGT